MTIQFIRGGYKSHQLQRMNRDAFLRGFANVILHRFARVSLFARASPIRNANRDTVSPR
jgi:hypothetical protein